MLKVCLKRSIEDGGRGFPQGICGRAVLRTAFDTWLVEFKYPDFAFPCRTKRVYAEVSSKDFHIIDEATQEVK